MTYEGNTGVGKGKTAGVRKGDRSKSFVIGYGKTAKYDPSNLDPFTGPVGRAAK